MHLWTEYEGNTLAGYPLGRLTRSEGRSAFFATTTPDGKPALLRLTESHFDDSELIGRWQKIAAVKHPNLQAIGHSGQITFDEVPLACCLLEPVDMSLADVLRERALTTDETKEVAEAVAAALAALHAAGLIHEHIDATNVFALGETVKLRSDCARECLGDFEADTAEAREALRQRDVRDLGLLLLRCLGLDWQGNTSGMSIVSPFDRIVPRALDGTFTAEGIVSAFEVLKPAPIALKPTPIAATVSTDVSRTPMTPSATPVGRKPTARPATNEAANSPAAVLAAIADRSTAPPARAVPAKPATDDPFDIGLGSLRNEPRQHDGTTSTAKQLLQKLRPMRARSISRNTYIASSAAAVMLGVVLWNTAFSKPPAATGTHATVAQRTPQTVPPAPMPKPSAMSEGNRLLTSSAQAGWRVIAYTYNYEQQAQAKAMQIQGRYAALQPQVFSPTGRAPYFVALGGPSDAASAMALRNRARHAGLPRDTYARNF